MAPGRVSCCRFLSPHLHEDYDLPKSCPFVRIPGSTGDAPPPHRLFRIDVTGENQCREFPLPPGSSQLSMRTCALVSWRRQPAASEAGIDRELAELVGLEILRNELDPAAWSRALAATDGVRQDALAEYTRIRIRQLSADRPARASVFAGRHLKRRSVRSVQDILERSNRGDRLNLPKPKLSLAALVILMLGITASTVCLVKWFEPFVPVQLRTWLPLWGPLAGVSAVLGALLARSLLPKFTVRHDWNTWVAIVGVTACSASLYLGSKLVVLDPPELIRELILEGEDDVRESRDQEIALD